MKVYVLYEAERDIRQNHIIGVFTDLGAAKSFRPNLEWQIDRAATWYADVSYTVGLYIELHEVQS